MLIEVSLKYQAASTRQRTLFQRAIRLSLLKPMLLQHTSWLKSTCAVRLIVKHRSQVSTFRAQPTSCAKIYRLSH